MTLSARTFKCSQCEEEFVSLHPAEMSDPPVCHWCILGPERTATEFGFLKPMIDRVLRIMMENANGDPK